MQLSSIRPQIAVIAFSFSHGPSPVPNNAPLLDQEG